MMNLLKMLPLLLCLAVISCEEEGHFKEGRILAGKQVSCTLNKTGQAAKSLPALFFKIALFLKKANASTLHHHSLLPQRLAVFPAKTKQVHAGRQVGKIEFDAFEAGFQH